MIDITVLDKKDKKLETRVMIEVSGTKQERKKALDKLSAKIPEIKKHYNKLLDKGSVIADIPQSYISDHDYAYAGRRDRNEIKYWDAQSEFDLDIRRPRFPHEREPLLQDYLDKHGYDPFLR